MNMNNFLSRAWLTDRQKCFKLILRMAFPWCVGRVCPAFNGATWPSGRKERERENGGEEPFLPAITRGEVTGAPRTRERERGS